MFSRSLRSSYIYRGKLLKPRTARTTGCAVMLQSASSLRTKKVDPFDKLNERSRTRLDYVIRNLCHMYYGKMRMPQENFKKRLLICKFLQDYLQENNSSTTVHAFGSTINGYGFRNSDVDIFVDGISFDEAKSTIQNFPDFKYVHAVKCRVPLLKFNHRKSGMRGDISFNNKLGLINSQMLHRYSTINKKSRLLVYMMKGIVKSCRINGNSGGFLSSYAYTIMTIYYLQQLNVPTLPVLQEIFPNRQKKKKEIVDECNVYYYKEDLEKVWPDFNKNTETLSQLLFGMLKFYAYEFDFEENVVCIRQKKLIPRSETNYDSSMIIRDPFEDRNLAGTVSENSCEVIRECFHKAYHHFAKLPRPGVIPFHYINYYFDENSLENKQRRKLRNEETEQIDFAEEF